MTYVLATSRPWNEVLAKRLEEKTGKIFHLVTQTKKLTFDHLEQIKPQYVFFPHWSHNIPRKIFESFECVIFHMTDLPYGRGGSPLQNLIKRGHKVTKISALRCVAQLDAGPIYMKRPLSLEGSASEIYLRAADVIETMIEDIVAKKPDPKPQQGEPVVFPRRTPEQSDLCEAQIFNLNDLFNHIRMLDADGYPKAFVDLHGHRVELAQVTMENDKLCGTFEVHPKNKKK